MARPPLPVGAHGNICVRPAGKGRLQARAYFRDHDGVTRSVSVTVTGKSTEAARRALQAKLVQRATPPGGDYLNAASTVSELARSWLAELEEDKEVQANTLADYKRNVDQHIKPALGELRLAEATASRLDRAVRTIRGAGKDSTARQVLSNLTQMFDHAVRHDAIPLNPVRSVKRVKVKKKEVRALTVEDLPSIAALIRRYAEAKRPGPKVNGDLFDVMALQLATGARIGEVLGMRWRDLEMDDQGRTWWSIRGQVIKPKGKDAGPVFWQPEPKTHSGFRRLLLPTFAQDILLRRQAITASEPLDAVFVSRAGTWKDPHNLRRQWRAARAGSDYEWVVPHTMRKTTGTALHHALGPEAAKAQLGHSSAKVTEEHYVVQLHAGPEGVDQVMEPFGEALLRGDAAEGGSRG